MKRQRKQMRRCLALTLAVLLMSGNAIPVSAEAETASMKDPGVETEAVSNSDPVLMKDLESAEVKDTESEAGDVSDPEAVTEQNTGDGSDPASVTKSEEEKVIAHEEGQLKDSLVVPTRDDVQGIAAFAARSYAGSYGEQLDGRAEELYQKIVDYYVDRKMTGVLEMTLETPITFAATIQNGMLVKDENYQQAFQEIGYQAQAAIDAFSYDYPEIYWMRSGSYSYSIDGEGSETGYVGIISKVVYTPEKIYENADAGMGQFEAAVSQAKAEIEKKVGTSDRYALLRAIHAYVCETAYYHIPSEAEADYLKAYSAEPIFTGDGGVVCEGYAKAVKILCDQFEIPCALISGEARGSLSEAYEPHMWNYVQMSDGKWYLIDATWDDQEDQLYDTYFLAGSESRGEITIREERVENPDFSNAKGMLFTYPVLSENAYEPGAVPEEPVKKPAKVVIRKIVGSSSALMVSWNRAADAEGYQVYMATAQNGSYTRIASLSNADTLSYTKTKLAAGKTYYFKVRAYRKDGNSSVVGSFSEEKSAATSPGTPSITALTGQAGAITVKWGKVSGATGYEVYMATSSKGTYRRLAVTGSSTVSYKAVKLAANKNYYFKIRAYRKGGMNTAYGKYSGIKYTGTATATPKIAAVSSGRKQLTVKWSKVANATQYEVYMATSSGGKYTKVATLKSTSTSYTKTGLKDGTAYYFKIRTVRSVGGGKAYSSYSNVKGSRTTAIYYITKTGKSYHRAGCATTKRSKNLKAITSNDAKKKGYKPCKVCKP